MKHLLRLIDKLSNFYNIKISAQPTTTGWVNITINDYSVELPLPDDEEKTVDTLFRFNVLDEIFPEKSFEELVAKSLVPNPCFNWMTMKVLQSTLTSLIKRLMLLWMVSYIHHLGLKSIN